MFIETDLTPNPLTIKFLTGSVVMASGTAGFASVESAAGSPLARRIFALSGVAGVFFGYDFVSVTKQEDADWAVLKTDIITALLDHHHSGELVIGSEAAGVDEHYASADADIVSQIKELLETRVRPAVAMDGGDIIFRSFSDGVVSLHLQGACAGCPSSTATLKMGIENMLKHYVPEVTSVRAVG